LKEHDGDILGRQVAVIVAILAYSSCPKQNSLVKGLLDTVWEYGLDPSSLLNYRRPLPHALERQDQDKVEPERMTANKSTAEAADVNIDVRHTEALLKTGALQSAIFNSANFSSIATDAKGVIQIFNVGAERMLGYTAAEVMNKITPADISDPQEVIARAKALSVELGTPITPGFEAL